MNKNSALSEAVRLLSRRDMSVHELQEALVRRGLPQEEAQAACLRMQEMGYADDDRLAEALTARYTRKAFGPYAIRAKLSTRGISREAVNAALASWRPDTDALSRFLTSRLRGDTDTAAQRRAHAAMMRRGFSASDAADALRAWINTYADTPDEASAFDGDDSL